VTGGAGFIGHHLVRALCDRDDVVTVIDDLSTGSLERLRPLGARVRLVEASILDAGALARAMEDCEVVFHLAALASVARSFDDPAECDALNVTGTIRVLEAAGRAGASRVILASSAAVYGAPESLPCHEDLVPAPTSPYGASKLAAEHYMHIVGEHLGVATVALRFFNVFGPGQDPASQYAAVVPAWIADVLRGDRPVINGDGGITRDFIHVGNAVSAALLASGADAPSRLTCNIASGQATSLEGLLASIGASLGSTPDPVVGPARLGDIRHSVADISRAGAELAYEVVVPFDEGIADTVAWYRSTGPA
jgi:UDP-glucose 4-epimerase